MLRRALLMLCFAVSTAPAQQLAHPGWRGNNIAPEAWWRHTTVIRLANDSTFAQAQSVMDPMGTIAADTFILPDLAPPEGSPQPFAEHFGTEDQLDTLLREASARRMHVLLRAPLARLTAHPGEVRFWMNRGIAGFDLGTITTADTASLQALRSSIDHFPGQRILLARQSGDIATDRKAGSRTQPLFFRIATADNPQGDASAPQFVETASIAADKASNDQTLLQSFLPLLLSPGQPIFDTKTIFSAEGRAALQQILAIRNTHPGVRNSQAITLQSPMRAWLLKSNQAGQRSLVVLENTSTTPLNPHLEAPLRTANAHGSFLRPILRTDNGMGAIGLESSLVPAGALVIAELQ